MNNQIALPQKPRRVGMDIVEPYGMYLDGVEVAVYDTEAEAQHQFEARRRAVCSATVQRPQLQDLLTQAALSLPC